ncbi:Uncharacterised protein [Mycobacteroides abscessus subsp. abscessus]|nr:Uncharacterised protein [Mycobacteroides abscessus subsp. abscessus]SIN29631.1 Uncharacterised protein [Mycobacteroides abscessus subsp. abscessus]
MDHQRAGRDGPGEPEQRQHAGDGTTGGIHRPRRQLQNERDPPADSRHDADDRTYRMHTQYAAEGAQSVR